MSQYEVGTKVRGQSGKKTDFAEGVILAFADNGDALIEITKQPVASYATNYDVGRIMRKTEHNLDLYYEVIPDFFMSGRIYRSNSMFSDVRYYVIEVFTNVNPLSEGRRLQALARKTLGDESNMVLLNSADFSIMKLAR